ncbi:pentapeptide repeat-containing protein [Nodosilinea nodulosa]|uniref:pentapeptide repeat-containing protein n=1 Tax=Nodosilinea nodulosa TaxID=416001 RepID=UPI00030FDDE8|nr:pentapeptide repeat-containing protein [Nodosilinea nodulosa]
MGSPTHLVHLKQNIETWNRWRNDNPTIKPDLSEAYLCATALCAVNLSGANLHKVDLYSADLWGADLSYADARAANLNSANLCSANLAGANLAEAELLSANLSYADLRGANLHRANLSMTNLAGANLTGADLTGANLKGAKLTNANLTNTRLTGAEMTGIMVSDMDISVLVTLQQVTCDHVYVLSCLNQSSGQDGYEATSTYTACFRSALHQFYQSFVEACDQGGPHLYRVAWPSAGIPSPLDIYLQSVERQGNGDLMVRVGVPGLKAPPPTAVEKPTVQQLFSTLGRGDFYRQQLQVKEDQMATVQRQNDELLDLLKAMTRQNVYVQSVSVTENSIMTGVSKYDMRGANIGSFADTVEAGGQQKSVQYNQHAMDTVSDFELVVQVEELLQQLAEQAPQVPAHQRPQMVSNALQKKARVSPEFKARLLKALEAGSGELIRVFTQNPYISIPLALVKGWVSVA